MINPSPEDLKVLFSEVYAKFLSKDLHVQQVFASKAFGDVTEAMVSHVQKDHPGMEGMMSYAKEHGFDATAARGMWIGLGLCAALKGPKQKNYIAQAAAVSNNLLTDKGFAPIIADLKTAFQIANGGAQHTLMSTFSKAFRRNLAVLMEPASQPIEPGNHQEARPDKNAERHNTDTSPSM
ncbi:hypothetical protein IFT48_03710 [Pseudomonas fluorescens]|uniref:hypothetical protein n=1 Tax=Pseudomonas TaxID=286 RepID=UPI000F01396E|nr:MULTISPECIES: hypothetical protein [Pseudomonas]MBD8089076.1 hypothetical protein [Pseudomonas fluorescens]MBD8615498.1 hypothetical protein [Pseudomonas putida]MBD8681849.1 hypothetical protein [Pseudomonas sp. CFBP 13719]